MSLQGCIGEIMRSKIYVAAGDPAVVEGSPSNNITGQKRRTIRSPVDGVVTARMLAAGEFVYEQSPILEIAEINPLFVETFLPIDLYQYVRGKETATVVPAAPVSGRFEAKISVVDQVFDAARGVGRRRRGPLFLQRPFRTPV